MADLEPAVRAGGLLAAGRRVLVLVSGGRDSVALLDLAVRIAGSGAVAALHVNYRLRSEAGGDERHCAVLCARLGVGLTVHRPGPAGAGNRQAWARRERYAAAWALAGGAEIAAGHTASDQVETILYRLASSPSRRALLGMRGREGASSDRPPLVRPLLAVTREQTAAHCRARGLAWREDASNATDAYARGRIRHELVPALRRVHPAAPQNVLVLAETLADEAAVLDQLVDGILRGRSEIGITELRAQPRALRRLLVQRLADAAAGSPAAGAARRAEEVAALPERGVGEVHLPHGIRARARAGTVRFDRTPPPHRGGPRSG